MELAWRRPTAFPVTGWGGQEPWRRLRHAAPLEVARAPHDADLLLLAGEIPTSWSEDLCDLLETLPLPRAVVWLRPPWPADVPKKLPVGVVIEGEDGSAARWRQLARQLFDRRSPGNRRQLPDEPPAPWRGVGEHGQGGEGMAGGRPYGRPMAGTHDDRDDLALGDVPTHLGPWFPGLPCGLAVELRVQGDRIRTVEKVTNLFPRRELTADNAARLGEDLAPALSAARGEEVEIARIERARLRSHLAWMAGFLELAGLDALGRRYRRAALEPPGAESLSVLFRRVRRTGLPRICRGLGVVAPEAVAELGLSGPLGRASGREVDSRLKDPAYRALGFEPRLSTAGDAWARWQVRAGECLESARLIAAAARATTRAAEGPRGEIARRRGEIATPSRAVLALVERLLPGLEWSQAVLTLASLDLDMAEGALR